MLSVRYFVGVDISKLTLDVAVIQDGVHVESLKIDNSEKAIRALLAKLKKEYSCTPGNTYFCAELMGLLHRFLADVLTKKGFQLCLEVPLRIKRSLGIQRGKEDALDAIRISHYAQLHYPKLQTWEPLRPCLAELQSLCTLRRRLLKVRMIFGGNEKSEKYFLSAKEKAGLTCYYKESRQALSGDITKIEERIVVILQSDERLHRLSSLIMSVPRLGQVIACEMLIHTNEFKHIDCPRKFASYCGIAPFPHSSGTSLKGRPKISPIANRQIKSLLHLAAMGCMRSKESVLARYYSRKVAEGKNKMCVLNAVRNKLVHYAFACVREDRMYVEAGTNNSGGPNLRQ